ncbi:nicotinate-nucleotide--dimethylbenzimidazole phosphoribosyltransferase, partial [Guyparkeria sp. 1SP6A2]|nr:nicotinate-nucleotide--dimethylbenzimidazole phosphoribosyltransferase [Guyparkeria sp. 1SP6A2]
MDVVDVGVASPRPLPGATDARVRSGTANMLHHDAMPLDDARQALQVPLGDLQARLALEQAEPDEAKARQGFLQGGNARADIPRLVFSFRYARDIG